MNTKHRSDFLKRGINKKGKPYSAWTKEGVRNWIAYVLHHREAMAEVHAHLIAQNIKLAALMFSTPAGPGTEENFGLGTCGDLPCRDLCYALRAENFRPSAFLADMENALMLRFAFDRCVAEVTAGIAKYRDKCRREGGDTMVRWHQSGEFTPKDSALLDAVSERVDEAKYYGYTKKPFYYRKYYNHPNINILWSAWRGMPIPEEVLNCGPLKAFFVEFADGKNEYMADFIKDKRRVRRCPGLIKGEFACNKCGFACAKPLIMIAHEH